MDFKSFHDHLGDRGQLVIKLVKSISDVLSPKIEALPEEFREELGNTIFQAAQDISEDLYTMLGEAEEDEEEEEY